MSLYIIITLYVRYNNVLFIFKLIHNIIYRMFQTGRLFIRNLAYTCQQEDLEEHFGKYGMTKNRSL